MPTRSAVSIALVIFVNGICRGGMITFTPLLDADNQSNTSSAASPYSASTTTQSDVSAGIVDDGVTTSHTDTFFYSDSATGIAFSFDVSWDAIGGALQPTTLTLGIGSNSSINENEGVSMSVDNLSVDLSGYVSGSVDSITNANLVNSSIAFDTISFSDWANDGQTNVNIFTDSDLVTYAAASPNFNLGTDGLTTSETELTFALALDSPDSDFSIGATEFAVVVELAQAPEPSCFGILGVLLGSLCLTRTPRRRTDQEHTHLRGRRAFA